VSRSVVSTAVRRRSRLGRGYPVTRRTVHRLTLTDFDLMLTSRQATLPLSMTAFLGEQGTDWGGVAAAGRVIMIPALIFSIFVQKQMARGLSFGAVKG
jgi:ABC-type maltose transport system permease subunit